MFYKEHEPQHFHAEHSGNQAKFSSTASCWPVRFVQRRRASGFARGRLRIVRSSRRTGEH